MKKNMIATTRDQSGRLLRCGVSADTADMSWVVLSDDTETLTAIPNLAQSEVINYPAWSLSALLGLLPKVIKAGITTYKLNIDYQPIGQVAIRYNTEEDEYDSLYGLMDDDLFELIVLMIEKLTADGHKLNDI